MIKILLLAVGALVALLAAMFVIGALLPKTHRASVRAHYNQPAAKLYQAITDVARGAEWRTGLQKVEVLQNDPLKWREDASWGNLTMVMDDAVEPTRVVSRIADTSQGFGGTWTYEITPEGKGSVLTITERGEVYNPMFRFMSKFVFGHYKSLETYASDLGRRFGETTRAVRTSPDLR